MSKENKNECINVNIDSLSSEIDLSLRWFIDHIDSIIISIGPLMWTLKESNKKISEDEKSFKDKYCTVLKKEKVEDYTIEKVNVPYHKHIEWKKLIRKSKGFSFSYKLIPQSVFVSLVSIYDAYLGKLLKVLFFTKPEVLNTSERRFSFSEIASFYDINEAKQSIVNKEIESVLRKNHAEQLKYIENTFSIKISPNKELFNKFIELTERRNLFVHCDGVISQQYIDACNNCGLKIDDKEIGKRLSVNSSYLKESYEILYEMAVQLTHVLWRKFYPNDLENADINLMDITFDLLCIEKYTLAQKLLHFSCEKYIKHYDDMFNSIFIINKALSFHLDKNNAKCKEILSEYDWSAKADNFLLAYHVLNKDWKKAVTVMNNIGNQEIWTTHYRDWPLFTKFRETKAFLNAYKKIYGKNFNDESATEGWKSSASDDR